MSNALNIKQGDVSRVKFCSHSPIIYWWPVWFFGYLLGLLAIAYGDQNLLNHLKSDGASWHTMLNLLYVGLILFVIYFTNIRTESNHVIIAIAFIVIILLLLSLLLGPSILTKYIPSFLVFMNASFFFTFSTGLLLIWLFVVFVVDQNTAWYLEPGRVVYKQIFPVEEKIDTMEGLTVTMTRGDVPCHFLLGLGLMGDVELIIGSERRRVIVLNVANVGRKVRDARQLVTDSFAASQPGSVKSK